MGSGTYCGFAIVTKVRKNGAYSIQPYGRTVMSTTKQGYFGTITYIVPDWDAKRGKVRTLRKSQSDADHVCYYGIQ